MPDLTQLPRRERPEAPRSAEATTAAHDVDGAADGGMPEDDDQGPSADIFAKCESIARADAAEAAGVFPFFIPVEADTATTATVRGTHVLMFGSNNYLGLTHDPRVREAALAAIREGGVACTGSRLLNGTAPLHRLAEEKIAAFMQRQECVIFTTGYQANVGVISALVGRHDYVIVDAAGHASIRDGCRLSWGETRRFKHNDVADLKRILERLPADRGKLIVVDGVYSMEGDIAPLPEIVELKNRYNARLVVDDAHAIGVLGAHGRGTAEHFGVEDQIDIVTGTFSKSLASIGGFAVATRPVMRYVRLMARPFLFSASPLPAAVAAAMCALDIVQQEPERRERLRANADRMRDGIRQLGFRTGHSQTPIIPVIIGPELLMAAFWNDLLASGLYVNAVTAPAVPAEASMVRISCTAEHTFDQVDQALAILARVGRSHGLI